MVITDEYEVKRSNAMLDVEDRQRYFHEKGNEYLHRYFFCGMEVRVVYKNAFAFACNCYSKSEPPACFEWYFCVFVTENTAKTQL